MDSKIEKSYKCEICNSSFMQKVNLTNHFSSVHEEKKPFECELCEYSCSKKTNLKEHIATVHENYSNAVFVTTSALKRVF